jgi:hypothetical protein
LFRQQRARINVIGQQIHPFGISLPGLLKHVRILEQRTW